MEETVIYDEETILRKWYQWMGYALILGFLFPVYTGFMGQGKLLFVNIEGLNHADFMGIIGLLYPLFAGVLALWAVYRFADRTRPALLLPAGLIPILLTLFHRGDYVGNSVRDLYSGVSIIFLLVLSLIGLYVGSRVLSRHDHSSGRILGAVSGITFMVLVLLPLGASGVPIYFELFRMLKGGGGSSLFFSLLVIVAFTMYLYASMIGLLNLREHPNYDKSAQRATKLVFIPTMALPAVILLFTMLGSGGGKGMMLTTIVKTLLLIGGIIGLVSLSLRDLIEQSLPKTFKGGQLISADAQPGGDGSPARGESVGSGEGAGGENLEQPIPSIYEGPPVEE